MHGDDGMGMPLHHGRWRAWVGESSLCVYLSLLYRYRLAGVVCLGVTGLCGLCMALTARDGDGFFSNGVSSTRLWLPVSRRLTCLQYLLLAAI